MTRKFKFFLIVFILSLPFWWGMNLLEKDLNEIFFWQEISQNPQIFTAQIALEESLRSMKPIRDKTIPDFETVAASAISVFINNEGGERILFQKESNEKLPIASLTKLMTALVVLNHYDLSKEIRISKEAVAQEENFGKLIVGKDFKVEYLLFPLLMESSNDAAFALSNDYDGMSERKFVKLMNWEAENLNLNNTFFDNPTGLDPEESKTKMNYSTTADLIKLTKELLKRPLIWEILSTQKYEVHGPELINTNELLFDQSLYWQERIIGGKTGYTEEAGGCVLLVLNTPKSQGFLINIILGTSNSSQRFREMKRMVEWIDLAYKW